MKKLFPKSRILSLIAGGVLIIIILTAVKYALILLVYGINPMGTYKERNRRPDDELSRVIKKVTGDDFYYRGKEEWGFGVILYEYQIKKQDREAVANLANTLNTIVKNEPEKVSIWVGMETQGRLEEVFSLENFSDAELDEADYDGMYSIGIYKPKDAHDTCFDSPSVYTEIEGIRKLTIDAEMKKQAEKEGIDWYEIWPDLEEVEVVGQ